MHKICSLRFYNLAKKIKKGYVCNTSNNKDKNINTDNKKKRRRKSGQMRVPGSKGVRSSETVVRHTETNGLEKKEMGLKDCGRM